MPTLRNKAWLLLAVTITIQLVVLRSTRSLKVDPSDNGHVSYKRSEPSIHASLADLPYAEWYVTAPVALRPFIALAILLILIFLFSFIGISASDFFCPNLSTIAAYLGLNESTAGVTFLAFGNGSPDVFSTFSALKEGTFGLAIGELIGAATFIISIVVGSIAFIRPFHVPRQAFLRDVVFFTVAVIVLITVLRDGHLTVFESGGMVVLYLAYVLVVIAGNWFSKRRRDKEARNLPASERSIHGDDGNAPMPPVIALPPASLDDSSEPNNELFSFPQTPSPTSLSPTASPRPHHHHSKSHALTSRLPHFQDDVPSYSLDTPRATFSLLGAIEFRDVVNSLRKESESHSSTPRSPSLIGESREDYFGPISAYGHRRALSQGGSLKKSSQTRGRQRAATYRPHLETQGRFASSPEVARVSSASPSREVLANGSAPPPDSNPWEDQLGNPASSLGPTDPSSPKPPRPRVQIPTKPTRDHSSLPTFSVTDPEGNAAAPPDTAAASRSSRTPSPSPPSHESRFRIRRHTRMALRVLFPSLQSFRHKSYIGMALAIMSVPAILALTLTLPVVDDGQTEGGVALPKGQDEPLIDDCAVCEAGQDDDGEDRLVNPEMGEELHHLVESGFTPLRSPLGRIHHSALRRMGDDLEEGDGSEGMTKELLEEIQQEEALEFHKALTAMQCVLGPMFCVVIIFRDMSYFPWILLGSALAGCAAGGAVLYHSTDGNGQPWKLVRCFAGFVCSMVWIAAIADEVVGVLQAVGEILGLSDAIIGLTIFAVGNSLADLVANVTVAQFAPAMAYAACFGGPMLNLLLGVGGSGTYHMLFVTDEPVTINFSHTLWVSAAGLVLMLVATAVFVPLNGYLIDRRWAGCLIVAYGVIMMVNVGVEVKTGRS